MSATDYGFDTDAEERGLRAENSRLRAQIAELQRDAERYDFLRRLDHFGTVDAMLNGMTYHSLDAAVDAAMIAAAGGAAGEHRHTETASRPTET